MNVEERMIALEKEVEGLNDMWFCSTRVGIKELFSLIMDYLEIEIEDKGNVIIKKNKVKEN